MSDTKLRCCPFCGGEAELHYIGYDIYFIGCKECGCKQAGSIHKKAVINAWNTRKPIDRIVEQMERLPNREADYYYASSNDVIDREDAIEIVKEGGIDG